MAGEADKRFEVDAAQLLGVLVQQINDFYCDKGKFRVLCSFAKAIIGFFCNLIQYEAVREIVSEIKVDPHPKGTLHKLLIPVLLVLAGENN